MNYNEKMADALDLMNFENGDDAEQTFQKILKAGHIFKEIADYCKQVPLYIEEEERRNEYKKYIESETSDPKEIIREITLDVLLKVVNAPFRLAVTGVVVLIIPYLSDCIEQWKLLEKGDEINASLPYEPIGTHEREFLNENGTLKK